jgi:hypothetical protein
MSNASTSAIHSPTIAMTVLEDASGVQRDSEFDSSNGEDSPDAQSGVHEHSADGVHRSHHADSGLDVSEDVDQDGEQVVL